MVAESEGPGGAVEAASTPADLLKGDAVAAGLDRQTSHAPIPDEHFHLLADHLPTLCWMANGDGYIFWYNRGWYEYTGATPDQMEGWGWQTVHDPQLLPSVLSRWTASIETGAPFEMIFPLLGADGAFRPFLTRVRPIKDPEGRVVRWFGVNTDISGQVAAEEAVRDLEAEQSTILGQLAEGVIVTDAEGVITYVNNAAALLHGVKKLAVGPEDYSDAYQLLTEDGRPYPPHDLPLARAVQRAETVVGERWRIRHPDGREVIATGSAQPLLSDSGRQVGAILTVRDDTARVKAEGDLRRLNDTLESRVREGLAERKVLADVVETTDAMIMVLDLDYRVLAINRANADEFERVFGVRPAVGDDILELLAAQPEHRDQVAATWGRALAGEAFTSIEAFGDPERDRPYYEIKFNVLADAGGKQIGAYQFVYDVTERLRQQAELDAAKEALRQSQKMEAVGQLTGGIAHDFNNMLAIVIGSLDMATRRLTDADPRAKSYVANAMEGARRAATLTQRLLAFSRQQALEPAIVDVNRLVGGMSDLLQRSLSEEIQLETVLAGGLWSTHVDPHQLENAILNLAVNAKDAMPGGGCLTIETHNTHLDDQYAGNHSDVPAGQYVMVAVTDSGSGMSQAVAAAAFDPFFTTKEVGKGTGLGLSMVYGFVKQSRGHVKIYSEVGHGTTVKIYLPRYAGAAEALGENAHAASERLTEGTSDWVLVVEDEPGVRRLSADALTELGYCVLEAASGAAALAILEARDDVKVLFTDVIMPEMNGRQLADRARALRPELKVLFTTGYTRNAIVHNGVLDAGVNLIGKPFTVEQLGAKLRTLLRPTVL